MPETPISTSFFNIVNTVTPQSFLFIYTLWLVYTLWTYDLQQFTSAIL